MVKKNKSINDSNFIENINNEWALFLDRDGTINKLLVDDYVKNWYEFEFIDGVLEALEILKNTFKWIIIVTNQQGIGKKLMTEKDLRTIHVNMLNTIIENGGYIDEIYYCPYLEEENSPFRKPNPGMGIVAKQDFPDIDFKKSVMVGDSKGDMEFGKNLGMKTILLGEYSSIKRSDYHSIVDMEFYNLLEFAISI